MTIETVHAGRYRAEFDAENVDGPLLVITRPMGGGKYIQGAQAEHWVEEIATAIENDEADALCRAILDE